MVTEDTTLAGAIAGLVGAVAGSLLGIVLQWLGLTDRTFHDLAQVFILSRVHPGALGHLIGILAHFGVAGLFGAIFAHLIVTTTRKNIIVKGLFVGTTMWLLFVGFGNYFRMPRILQYAASVRARNLAVLGRLRAGHVMDGK